MTASKPLVWITRAVDGAARTQKALAFMGIDSLIAPILAVHALMPVIDPAAFDALIVTSINGLSGFVRLCARRDLPVWCVGDATAQAARDAGFSDVTSATGDVAALFKIMKAQSPRHLRYLYACAAQPSAPLLAGLWAEGFRAIHIPVYETREVTADLTVEQLAAVSHVLIHSARGAMATARFLTTHDLPSGLDALTFICISEAAAQALEMALKADDKKYPLTGITVQISAFPDEASMLKLIV